MIPRTLRKAIDAGRPPRPVKVVDAMSVMQQPPVVAIGISPTPESALALIPCNHDEPSLVVPVATPTTHLKSVLGAVRWMTRTSNAQIGVTPDNEKRWASVARSAGVRCVLLGRDGYCRTVFGERSLVLENADFPAEFFDADRVVIVGQPDGNGVLAGWTSLVHPNSALRARMSGNASVELAMAVPAHYLLVGSIDDQWFAAYASSAITAELVSRAVERLRKRRHGLETDGPWEDPGVQHLAELGEASPAVINLVPRLRVESEATGRVGRELAEMLGWQVDLEVVRDSVEG